MTYEALGYLKKNSPPATLTASMESTDNSATVDHLEYFHNSTGGLITKGIVIGPGDATKTKPETITITAASTTSGPGNLTGITRGVDADGTIGVASSWDSGTEIAVNYTYGRDKQIADNFEAHQTLITARATKTTAAMSVYVDAAATGTGDGTSWTDAFTTIQAAIDSLPVVLEHAVTIYVRKGTSAYAETVTVQQIVGKGSLAIRGEYYWHGNCAAAATPSATKFNTAAHTDGANIEVGDLILVTSSFGGAGTYTYYNYTTVKGVVDKGSNIYEIELDATSDWGNISASDYYTVVKTKINGYLTVSNSKRVSLYGLSIDKNSSSNYAVMLTNGSVIDAIYYCFLTASSGTGGLSVQSLSSCPDVRGSYLYGTVAATVGSISYAAFNFSGNTDSGCCALVTKSSGIGLDVTGSSSVMIYRCIINAPSGVGVQVQRVSTCGVTRITIPTGTTTGFKALRMGEIDTSTCNNQATTPATPANGASTPATYPWDYSVIL